MDWHYRLRIVVTPPVGAPAVVAVVVTRDPGVWFDEAMASLAAQDYPNLSVLVVDAGSSADPSARVAQHLPDAFVRRLDENPGFGRASNQAIEVVEGAAFYLFLHDDVALDPDAVRVMVEEAFRTNAGVVGPKLVTWGDERRLLGVGESVDKSGARAALVDRYELDQEQHDAVRDVFVIPGSVSLVRADLFETVHGFDDAIDFHNDDLALCWRAHLAGARVVVTPEAVARHVEALGDRHPVEDRRRLQNRHRVRTLLVCYSRFHLLRVVPQVLLIMVVEVLYALLVGRTRQARDLVHAWTWNLRRLDDIRAARREVATFRRVGDSEIRNLQVRGSARFSAFLRGQLGGGDEDRLKRATVAGRDFAANLQGGSTRLAIAAWSIVALVLLAGSRHLLTRGVPAIGEFAAFDESAVDAIRRWLSGWRTVGLGSESPSPTILGFSGLAGMASLGGMGLARQFLILGLLPVGLIGAYRMLRASGNRRAQVAALVAYAALPLPYEALSGGRWGALALWAASPWMLIQFGRASRLAPFADPDDERLTWRRSVLALAVITALVTLVLPSAAILVLVVAVALAAGSVLAAAPRGALLMLAAAIASAVLTFVLHAPWSVDFVLPGSEWASFVGADAGTRGITAVELVGLRTGDMTLGFLAYGILVAAGLGLVIGRGWRFDWAVRGWTLTLSSVALALVAERGWAPFALPPVETMLAPVASGLALSVGLGVVAFDSDLRAFRFGWRQFTAAAAGIGLVVATVPVMIGALDGRWSQPSGDLGPILGFLDDEQAESPFRTVWLGRPDALPLGAYQLGEGLGFSATDHGIPDLGDRFVAASPGPTGLIADGLDLARDGETTRLGRVFAPMAVRYVVVVDQLAPAPFDDEDRPVPAGLVESLTAQLDLEEIEVNPALTVFRNTAAVPLRASVPLGFGGDGSTITDAVTFDLNDIEPSLVDVTGHTTYEGPVGAGSRVFHAVAASDSWVLEVGGDRARREKVFGFAQAFTPSVDGEARLFYRTPIFRYAVVMLQAVLWIVALRQLIRYRLGPPVEEVR